MGLWESLKKVLLIEEELKKINSKFEELVLEIKDLKRAIDDTELYSKRLDTTVKYAKTQEDFLNKEIERITRSGEEKEREYLGKLEKMKTFAVKYSQDAIALDKENKELLEKVKRIEAQQKEPLSALSKALAGGWTGAGAHGPSSALEAYLRGKIK